MRALSSPHAANTLRRLWLTAACFALLLAAGGTLAATPAPSAASAASPAAAASPRAFVKHPQAVPILVYHHVQSYEAGYYLMYVGTSQFASQLAYLHRKGVARMSAEPLVVLPPESPGRFLPFVCAWLAVLCFVFVCLLVCSR